MHPSTAHLLRLFGNKVEGEHGLITQLRHIAAGAAKLPEDPEVSAALRKLLEAKDCIQRVLVLSKPATATVPAPSTTKPGNPEPQA